MYIEKKFFFGIFMNVKNEILLFVIDRGDCLCVELGLFEQEKFCIFVFCNKDFDFIYVYINFVFKYNMLIVFFVSLSKVEKVCIVNDYF